MSESNRERLYEVNGRAVYKGDRLHCPPHLFYRAGETVMAYRPADCFGNAVMRSECGAVPTVNIAELSWTEHPETVVMRDLVAAGFRQPTRRDVAIWMAAQRAQADQKGGSHG
jgi:hypothetical protein